MNLGAHRSTGLASEMCCSQEGEEQLPSTLQVIASHKSFLCSPTQQVQPYTLQLPFKLDLLAVFSLTDVLHYSRRIDKILPAVFLHPGSVHKILH